MKQYEIEIMQKEKQSLKIVLWCSSHHCKSASSYGQHFKKTKERRTPLISVSKGKSLLSSATLKVGTGNRNAMIVNHYVNSNGGRDDNNDDHLS